MPTTMFDVLTRKDNKIGAVLLRTQVQGYIKYVCIHGTCVLLVCLYVYTYVCTRMRVLCTSVCVYICIYIIFIYNIDRRKLPNR